MHYMYTQRAQSSDIGVSLICFYYCVDFRLLTLISVWWSRFVYSEGNAVATCSSMAIVPRSCLCLTSLLIVQLMDWGFITYISKQWGLISLYLATLNKRPIQAIKGVQKYFGPGGLNRQFYRYMYLINMVKTLTTLSFARWGPRTSIKAIPSPSKFLALSRNRLILLPPRKGIYCKFKGNFAR